MSRKTLIDLTSLHTYLTFFSIHILFSSMISVPLVSGYISLFLTPSCCVWFRKRHKYAVLKILEKFLYLPCHIDEKRACVFMQAHTYTHSQGIFWLFILRMHSEKDILCLLRKRHLMYHNITEWLLTFYSTHLFIVNMHFSYLKNG